MPVKLPWHEGERRSDLFSFEELFLPRSDLRVSAPTNEGRKSIRRTPITLVPIAINASYNCWHKIGKKLGWQTAMSSSCKRNCLLTALNQNELHYWHFFFQICVICVLHLIEFTGWGKTAKCIKKNLSPLICKLIEITFLHLSKYLTYWKFLKLKTQNKVS